VLPKDAIRSIDRPTLADDSIPEATRVRGLELDGDSRAHPVAILSAQVQVLAELTSSTQITIARSAKFVPTG